jgi:hypothetical protein
MNNKIVISAVLAVLSLGGSYYVYDTHIHKDDVKFFESKVSKEDSEDLKKFLYEQKGKFVKLSVTLSPDMVQDILKGIDQDGRIIFTAIDGENRDKEIQYLLRLPDSGKRDFIFDSVSGKLSGYFKTYRRVSHIDGSSMINLTPIPEHFLPQENGVIKQPI